MSVYAEPKFLSSGESCLVVEFADEVNMGANASVQALRHLVNAHFSGRVVRECVPTYRSLSINFDPLLIEWDVLIGRVKELLLQSCADVLSVREVVEMPVCYGGEYGPDIESVAAYTKLSVEEVVKRHTSRPYYCYMLGFTPGYPYLGGMDESLSVPRLPSPRTHIPMGTVAIAGTQTGVYPIASPGGWQLLGRTPLRLFDPKANPVTLIQAGEWVRFAPVSEEEYHSIEIQVNQGTYTVCRTKEAHA